MINFIAIIVTGFALLLSSPIHADAYAKGSQSCKECHKLDDQGAKAVLGALIPDVKVFSVEDGPVSGLWEIGFETGGMKSIAYVDYSLKYVIAGNILSIVEKKNLTQESFQRMNKVDFSQIPLKNALVMGDENAPHKVVVFDDPD